MHSWHEWRRRLKSLTVKYNTCSERYQAFCRTALLGSFCRRSRGSSDAGSWSALKRWRELARDRRDLREGLLATRLHIC